MVRLLARGGNPLTRAASAIQGNARNKVNQTTAANTKHPAASTQITMPIRRNARSSLLRILWGERRGSSLASVFRDLSLGMAKPFRRWSYFSDTMPEKGKRRAARSGELPTCLSQLKAFTNWHLEPTQGTLTSTLLCSYWSDCSDSDVGTWLVNLPRACSLARSVVREMPRHRAASTWLPFTCFSTSSSTARSSANWALS